MKDYEGSLSDEEGRKVESSAEKLAGEAEREVRKRALKKAYERRARDAAGKAGKRGVTLTEKAGLVIAKGGHIVWESIKNRKDLLIPLLAVVLTLAIVLTQMGSCMMIGDASITAFALSTYPSEDGDMLGAEEMYLSLEEALSEEIEKWPETHDYDEYRYDLDEFYHDPYVLISLVTAFEEGEWILDEAVDFIEELFENQYTLTEKVTRETRYRQEKRRGTVRSTNEDGTVTTKVYYYYVDVPYDWYVCELTLVNNNLSFLPVTALSEQELEMYAVYMAVLGNREDLFPGSEYQGRYGNEETYEIAPAALSDPVFAAMMEEALKYLGYPYVFGGSSPLTSFDCSGFVSWVLNHSGWDVGRLGATALCEMCTKIGVSELKPGDLVFFKGTYETRTPDAVSHCGIYVGNGMMIHAGDPIGFTDLSQSYWQEHLYAYGRLPSP